MLDPGCCSIYIMFSASDFMLEASSTHWQGMRLYVLLIFWIGGRWTQKRIYGNIPRISMIFLKLEKRYILESVQDTWRKHKTRLKKDHFDSYHNDEAQLQNIPEDVPASQFKELLWYWNSEKLEAKMVEIEAQQNKNGNESVDAFASVMGPDQSVVHLLIATKKVNSFEVQLQMKAVT